MISFFFLNNENDKGLAHAVFIAGIASCGTASNFWVVLHEGDSNLSVTLTFLSTLLSFGLFLINSKVKIFYLYFRHDASMDLFIREYLYI